MIKNNRREFLKKSIGLASLTTLALATGLPLFKKSKKPNIIFFLIDDLGWTDLGCYNSKVYKTPAIDKLAKEGVKFTDAYACHPMCLPSRVGVLSGQYPARLGVPGGKHGKGHSPLPLSTVTIAEALKKHDYKTFFAGKWHVGLEDAYPEHQGFDVNIGGHSKGQPATYFFPYKKEDHFANVPGLDKKGKHGEYLTDRLTDEAVDFITQNKKEQFFLFLSHYAVHTPLEAKEELTKDSQKIIDNTKYNGPAWTKEGPADCKMYQDNAVYSAMITSVDESVAKIRNTLQKLNLDDNTLIIFTSDNGGDSCKKNYNAQSTSTLPLRAGKCWLYEGGIRVPLIVSWPGKLKKNIVSDHIVTGIDHYPSILDIAGLPLRPKDHLDGKTYKNVVFGKKTKPRGPVFWNFPNLTLFDWVVGSENCSAIRHGKYKLIEFLDNKYIEMYNLEDDISEKNDLSKKEPEKAKELHQMLKNWRKEVDAPGPILPKKKK